MARWLEFFSQFEFVLHLIKGTSNVVADALSRLPDGADERVVVAQIMVHQCTEHCSHLQATVERQRAARTDFTALDDRDLDLLLDADFRGKGIPAVIGAKQVVYKIHASQVALSNVLVDNSTKHEFAHAYAVDPLYASLFGESTRVKEVKHRDGVFRVVDGLVYLNNGNAVQRVCVPANDRLRVKLLEEYHDGPASAHPGTRRTYLKLCLWYYWPNMIDDVRTYVSSCATCARFKPSSMKKNRTLMSLHVPKECWEMVGLDLVTGLPVSNGFDAIMTCVDRLSKRPKYAPTHTTATAVDAAKIIFDVVVRHHDLPRAIVNDRDSKFTSDFWADLMRPMGVKLNMTTSYRAQADGQAERQNRVLEDTLRCMVSIHDTNWCALLGTIEFAHVTLVNSFTKLTPFEIGTGRIPRSPIESTESRNQYAANFASDRKKIVEQAQANLKDAQDRMKQYYDRARSNVKIVEGDMVYLSTRNLPLAHAVQGTQFDWEKLSARYIGPFAITKMVNENVARLKLPQSMKRLHDSASMWTSYAMPPNVPTSLLVVRCPRSPQFTLLRTPVCPMST